MVLPCPSTANGKTKQAQQGQDDQERQPGGSADSRECRSFACDSCLELRFRYTPAALGASRLAEPVALKCQLQLAVIVERVKDGIDRGGAVD
jgi:hypothetical protein